MRQIVENITLGFFQITSKLDIKIHERMEDYNLNSISGIPRVYYLDIKNYLKYEGDWISYMIN